MRGNTKGAKVTLFGGCQEINSNLNPLAIRMQKFFYNISLKEEGFLIFKDFGMKIFERLFIIFVKENVDKELIV